jgi:hypothetical protein
MLRDKWEKIKEQEKHLPKDEDYEMEFFCDQDCKGCIGEKDCPYSEFRVAK